MAGHKGKPTAVQATGRPSRRNRLKAKRGRGTLAGEKPPVLGMVQRNGQVVIHLVPKVQQKTIQPLIEATIQTGATLYTDEYNLYGRLDEWGYTHT